MSALRLSLVRGNVAAGSTRYNRGAVKPISRNVELIRCQRVGGQFVVLDLLTEEKDEPALDSGRWPRPYQGSSARPNKR